VITLKTTPSAPSTEYSVEFLQGMVSRMEMSYFKYGAVADGFPHKLDAIASMKARLERYERTGNLEYLMDAANFLMIEFMHPRHADAHFTPEDSSKSPGRQWHGEVDRSTRANREL
jgi:hypothetical protein